METLLFRKNNLRVRQTRYRWKRYLISVGKPLLDCNKLSVKDMSFAHILRSRQRQAFYSVADLWLLEVNRRSSWSAFETLESHVRMTGRLASLSWYSVDSFARIYKRVLLLLTKERDRCCSHEMFHFRWRYRAGQR